MNLIKRYTLQRKERQQEKQEELRIKNFKLRQAGKDPHKGWNKMVDTGFGGANRAISQTGSGTIDITGQNMGTENYYSEEQRHVIDEVTRHKNYDEESATK